MHYPLYNPARSEKEILWGPEVEFVLLDMDGTLLDRHFDDYFWEDFLPKKYSEKYCVEIETAKTELLRIYKEHEGTLKWTDIDFWSEELGLDIPALKEETGDLIKFHPHAEDFLKALRESNKKIYLLTDAHCKVLHLKMKKTGLDCYFDAWITSFDIGYPKQDLNFWEIAEETLGFQKKSALFIDDREEILKTARTFGIKYTLYKANANSKRIDFSKDFYSVTEYKDLLNDF